jgi:RNA polymerase sigma factor (sigma-70 family)
MTSADDLLRSVQGGDPDYEGIYRAYGKLMYFAALRAYDQKNRVFDARDVEDVVHEAYLQVMERNLLTPDTKSIGGLLSTVAYRRALDHLRRGDRHANLDIDDVPDQVDVEDPYLAIEDELERTQIGAAVWDNWHRLNAQERAVYRGVIFEGRTHTDIAVDLGVSRERVGQVFRAALRKMTHGLNLNDEDGGGR